MKRAGIAEEFHISFKCEYQDFLWVKQLYKITLEMFIVGLSCL